MADFLRRLADRALGLASAVEARPGLDASRWWGITDAARDASMDEDGAVAPPRHVPSPGHVPPPRDVRSWRHMPNVSPGAADALESRPLSTPNDDAETPRPRRAPGPPTPPTPSDARLHEHGSPSQRLDRYRPLPDESRTLDAPQASRVSRTPAAREATGDEPAATPAPARTLVVPSNRDIQVTPAAARRAAQPSMAQPAPPSVHVTIGRLEVRALTNPAPAIPRAASPRPQLTLAEYLARRDRASR
jgi:hypothetical protein